MTLGDAAVGSTVVVTKISGDGLLTSVVLWTWVSRRKRALHQKVAPLGDPVEITVRGYELSMKRRCSVRRGKIIEPHNVTATRKESEGKMAIKIALAGNPNCGKTIHVQCPHQLQTST